MIRPEELRIGNFVECPQNNLPSPVYDKIEGIKENKIFFSWSNQCFDLKEINPIPLTEELLVKFGFEKYTDQMYILHFNEFSFTYLYTYSGGSWVFELNGDRLPLRYVHQLQNLYFALTGEELKIKE